MLIFDNSVIIDEDAIGHFLFTSQVIIGMMMTILIISRFFGSMPIFDNLDETEK